MPSSVSWRGTSASRRAGVSELEPGPDEEVVADFAANSRCTHWRCLSTASGNAVTRWLERVYASVGEHFPGADAVGDMRVFTGRVGVREYIVDSDGKKAVDPATGDAAVRVRTMSYDPAELPFPGLRQGCAQPGSHALMAASGRLEEAGTGLDRIRDSAWRHSAR